MDYQYIYHIIYAVLDLRTKSNMNGPHGNATARHGQIAFQRSFKPIEIEMAEPT